MNKQTLSARAPFDPHHQWTPAPPFYGSGAVKAYFALQIFGIFSCFILLITTWLSKTVHRDRSLYNAYVVLATACIFHSLTWFGGYAGTNPEPPGFQLCIAQASLIAGNSTAQPACVAALVFRVWLTTISMGTSKLRFLNRRVVDGVLMASPWVIWIVYTIVVVVTGLRDPSKISWEQLYCGDASQSMLDARHYTSAAMAAIVVLLELHLGWMVWGYFTKNFTVGPRFTVRRKAITIGSSDQDLVAALTQESEAINLPFTLRILCFGVYSLGATAIVIYIAIDKHADRTALPDLLNATLAPAFAITLGTQEDIWLTWKDCLVYVYRKATTPFKPKEVLPTIQLQINEPVDKPTTPKEDSAIFDFMEALEYIEPGDRQNFGA